MYRAKFDEAAVSPHDIRALEDVRKLPFTTKSDLRETYPFGMIADAMETGGMDPRATSLRFALLGAEPWTEGMKALTPHFVLELTREGHLDALTIRIERHPELDGETSAAAKAELRQRVKAHIGVAVDVQLEEPGTLPRSDGKYRRAYDLRSISTRKNLPGSPSGT